MFLRNTISLVFLVAFSSLLHGSQPPWIRIASDGRGFESADSQQPFTPWGLNYDHNAEGQLLEDYWESDWSSVDEDFSEMKQLGCNVVRIHLQFAKFMDSPTTANVRALEKLSELLDLAEKHQLYLNLTGLGCYHKQDVPAWYNDMTTAERWQAQANFWSAVSQQCAERSCIFCFDLMNEPVVHGGNQPREDWLGPGFGGKHFVQFICRDREGKSREDLAAAWTQEMINAIRQHDSKHLITVGLVPWSLNRPGLTSGFDPQLIAPHVDFLSVHIYPESDKPSAAMETLRGFARAGKPVVIEEIFPLKCSASELEIFIDESRSLASGWFGFYWGESVESLNKAKTIPAAITASWLELFNRKAIEMTTPVFEIQCEGTYPHHLQGICLGADRSIYWSFTTKLVKTDSSGRVLKIIDVPDHHGDLCWAGGKLYVAVNLGKFNDPDGNADSWVYTYDASDLNLVSKHQVSEVFHGAGGISVKDGQFFVVGGLPENVEENYVYQYDADFNFIKMHRIQSGHTHLGIQTALFHDGKWWFGCYGSPKILLVTDADFNLLGRYEFNCSLGIEAAGHGRYWTASGVCKSGVGCDGKLHLSTPNEKLGLRLLVEPHK